jgi:hypothetical protein
MHPSPRANSFPTVEDRSPVRRLRLILSLAVASALVACAPAAVLEPSATGPTASVDATSLPEATAFPSPAATSDEPDPTSDASGLLARDTLGEVVVAELVVRSAPGVSGDSKILEDGLTLGDLVYVVDGPQPADGYDWLLVSEMVLPWKQGTAGWIAPASRVREEWVRPVTPDCPDEVGVEAFASVPQALLLACFGGEEISLEGALGFCGHADPVVTEPAWLANNFCAFEAPARPAGVSEWLTLPVSIHPDADVPSFTGESRPLRITGRYDHPASETCRYTEGAEDSFPELDAHDESLLRVGCRSRFVLESAIPLN